MTMLIQPFWFTQSKPDKSQQLRRPEKLLAFFLIIAIYASFRLNIVAITATRQCGEMKCLWINHTNPIQALYQRFLILSLSLINIHRLSKNEWIHTVSLVSQSCLGNWAIHRSIYNRDVYCSYSFQYVLPFL